MRRLLLALLFPLLFCVSARGQVSCTGRTTCSTVANPTGAQILTALQSINLDGTVLTIPAGNSIITSQISYTQTNSFTLQGAGAISGSGVGSPIAGTGSDLTILQDNLQLNSPMLRIITVAGKSFRLTGIAVTYAVGNNVVSDSNGVIFIGGNSTSVRIDHNHINKLNNVDLYFGGAIQGVTDDNQFDAGFFNENMTRFTDPNWNGDTGGLGNGSWADSSHFGTSQFMFVENNNFRYVGPASTTCSPSADAHAYAFDVGLDGGRGVFRYNQVGFHMGLQTHGTSGGTQDHRGLRALEVYNNSFAYTTVPGDCFAFVVQLEGGENLWYNNTTSGFLQYIHNDVVRIHNTTYGETATPNGWGYCAPAPIGGVPGPSNWDQNSISSGYACLDSTGRGQGDLLSGQFPNKVNTTTGTIAWPHQVSKPAYFWSSPVTPVPNNPFTYFANASGAVTVENQDYYLQLPNHEEAATFNGTAGIGCGPSSDTFCTSPVVRPATCTVNVGYWNTSTQTLSQCGPTNVWTNFYTPFIHPHPLVSGTPTVTPPSSPTGLTGTVSGSTVNLSWTASSGTPIPTAYTEYRGTVHGGPYAVIQSGLGLSTTDAPANGTYFYVVTAYVGGIMSTVNGNGTTATVTCTASCAFPTGTVFTIGGNSQSTFNGTFTSTGQPTSSTFTFVSSTSGTGTNGGVWQSGAESARSNEITVTTPAALTATLAPASRIFANTTVGANSPTQTLTLTNTSGAGGTVTISNISYTGPNLGDFSQTNNCPSLLMSGLSCTITGTFTPTAPGARSATLTIVDNATGSPQTSAVSGTGVAATPIVTLNPTSLNFGQQTVSTTSAARSIIMTNTGSGTLTVTSVVASGDFAATTVPITNCGGTLAPLATCSINVTFTPTLSGGRVGAITITDNAAGSPHVASLTGTGITTKCAMTGNISLTGVANVCGP